MGLSLLALCSQKAGRALPPSEARDAAVPEGTPTSRARAPAELRARWGQHEGAENTTDSHQLGKPTGAMAVRDKRQQRDFTGL